MCNVAALLAVQTVQAQPPENGQSVQSFQDEIAYVRMRDAYASATFAREATFLISATLRSADWEDKKFQCSRFFGHDIHEPTDKSHTVLVKP